jgi:hypothetical protein
MRLPFALIALLALSACGASYGVRTGTDNDEKFGPNCAEQSALATNGRTDGRLITITCP